MPNSPRHPDGMCRDEFIAAVTERCAIAMVAALRAELANITKTCLTCDHWLEESQVCGKFNNMLPPPHVIANGCPAYESKGPPF